MSDTRNLIRQEIKAREQTIVGTALGNPEIVAFDASAAGGGSGAPVWTIPVEISSNRVLLEVPVKANGAGSRAYARRNATVLLRRNAQGRFEVIGPGDRVAGVQVKKTYAFGAVVPTTTDSEGFVAQVEPFEFYQGAGPPNSLWGDLATPFPIVRIIDQSTGLPI